MGPVTPSPLTGCWLLASLANSQQIAGQALKTPPHNIRLPVNYLRLPI
jgi:hypothetical protein